LKEFLLISLFKVKEKEEFATGIHKSTKKVMDKK